MTSLLESEGVFELADYPKVVGSSCHGCSAVFRPTDIAEVLLDRLGRRSYLIHQGCWSKLVDRLERGL